LAWKLGKLCGRYRRESMVVVQGCLQAFPTESDTQSHSLGQEIMETLRLVVKVATFHKIAAVAA
jgi:hypothetical protein